MATSCSTVRSATPIEIGLLTFAGYQQAPPLSKLPRSAGYGQPATAADLRGIVRLAQLSARYDNTHVRHVSRTNYGATVRSRAVVRPDGDGVYGMELGSGKVLGCYTIHQIDTYSMPGGLAQNESRQQWGALLAPGAYSSVTTDSTETQCVFGARVARKVGTLWLRYDPQVVSTTGVRLG